MLKKTSNRNGFEGVLLENSKGGISPGIVSGNSHAQAL
jgi:hypothetical protein